MSDSDYISAEHIAALLSTMTVDQLASILVSATLRDRTMPMQACGSLLNLVSTCGVLMSPVDRATVLNRMRDVADLLENTMLMKPDASGTADHKG